MSVPISCIGLRCCCCCYYYCLHCRSSLRYDCHFGRAADPDDFHDPMKNNVKKKLNKKKNGKH